MSRNEAGRKGQVPVVEIPPRESARLYRLHEEFPRGACVNLTDGEYLLSQPAVLPSNTTIRGAGQERTKIVLEKGADCHLFTNSAPDKGNKNLSFSGFSVHGNGSDQDVPPADKPVLLCCGIYLSRVAGARIHDCSFYDIRQTAAHFSNCRSVEVRNFRSRKLGWSGISTSNTSEIWIDAIVEEAGWDQTHPAIHIAGGIGVYVDATVTDVTGNGIMLDARYANLSKCVVKGSASRCLCGVSIRGTPETDLSEIYIEGVFSSNAELGILVSNSRNIVIAKSLVHGNGIGGIRFQGRKGGRDCLVVDTIVADNPIAYEHLHASGSNWVFDLQAGGDGSSEEIRKHTLAQRQRTLAEKRRQKTTETAPLPVPPSTKGSSGRSKKRTPKKTTSSPRTGA